jgi:hypothetical protein
MAVKLSLEKLPENLQAEVLTTHPNFHSYGFEARQEALKPFHRRNQQAESKRSNEVVKALRKNQATRKLTEALDKPAETPVVKPASTRVAKPEEKATRLASTTQLEEDRSKFVPASEIRQLLFKAGRSAVSEHANKLMSWAGSMEDHLSSYPTRGSDDAETNNETAKSGSEPTHVRSIRQHLAKFYDALGKHNTYHSMAEYPGGEDPSIGSDTYETGGQQLEGGGVEAGGTFRQQAGSRYGRDRQHVVDPATAITHRPLAKEFIKMAAGHLVEAAKEFGEHFPESDAHKFMPDLSASEAATKVADHYGATNLGEVTSKIRYASNQLMKTKAQRDKFTEKQQQQKNQTEGLHYSQLTDDAQAELFTEHPNFEDYPETDELAANADPINAKGDRPPSKDSILKKYQAQGRFESTEEKEKSKPLTHYQELLKRNRSPEQAFGLLLGGFRNSRTGTSVRARVGQVEQETFKAKLAKDAENAPEEDPNAKDKYGFTEQQHYDAFSAAHQHYFTNNRGDYKTYLKSTAYTHPAAYLADNLTPQKRGGRGGSMAAFRGED